jgi:hypothetical protein
MIKINPKFFGEVLWVLSPINFLVKRTGRIGPLSAYRGGVCKHQTVLCFALPLLLLAGPCSPWPKPAPPGQPLPPLAQSLLPLAQSSCSPWPGPPAYPIPVLLLPWPVPVPLGPVPTPPGPVPALPGQYLLPLALCLLPLGLGLVQGGGGLGQRSRGIGLEGADGLDSKKVYCSKGWGEEECCCPNREKIGGEEKRLFIHRLSA